MEKLKFQKFTAYIKSWEQVFQEAADFATSVGRENVVSISHSEDHKGIVTVWYWTNSRSRKS